MTWLWLLPSSAALTARQCCQHTQLMSNGKHVCFWHSSAIGLRRQQSRVSYSQQRALHGVWNLQVWPQHILLTLGEGHVCLQEQILVLACVLGLITY
jgi:hypothetical protein